LWLVGVDDWDDGSGFGDGIQTHEAENLKVSKGLE
jgi:hypothetical protein